MPIAARLLVAGFAVTLGATDLQEASLQVSDERREECVATARRIAAGDFTVGDLSDEHLSVCRRAMLAEDVLLVASGREGDEIADEPLQAGLDTARRMVAAFNESGARTVFELADRWRVEGLRVALLAEACLGQPALSESTAAAARGVLEEFHRSPDNPAYGAGRQQVEECMRT